MRKRVVPNSKYTIKRYFESVDQVGNFVEDKSKEEVVEGQTPGTEVELSPTQTNAPTGFTLASGTVVKKKINKDGSTVFELRYTRNRYNVNFEVNYNGNHFAGATASAEATQNVPYEGKVKKPEYNPSLTKPGHTYTFKHWQLKDAMGNVYKEVQEFDFANTKITKPTTLVAYFEENVQTVKYTIKHIYKGFGSIQNIVEIEQKNAQVGTSVTVTQADAIAKVGFEIKPQSQTKTIHANGQTTFVLEYVRKTYTVEYNYNSGILNGEAETSKTYKFEEILRDVDHPEKIDPTHQKTYTFAGWQDEETGQMIDFSENHKVVKNLKLKAIWQESMSTRPIYLKMVWEKINESNDQTVEQQITKPRKIGETAKVTDPDIQTALTQFLANNPHPNHETNFDAVNSVTEVTATASLDKHYITVYFKAKTYTVNFDRSGLLNSSVADELKQEIVLKYSQKLSADLIAKMKAVKKASTGNKDYVFEKLIETVSGQTFQEGIAYNKNITLKPVFAEKDVLVDVTPKVADHDKDKADASSWEQQTGKVGDVFSYTPMQGVKKGWRLVGWAKTNNGIAETIYYARGLKEVYAVFAPAETTYTIKHVFKGIQGEIQDEVKTVTKNALTNSSVQLTNADKYHDFNENGFEWQLPPSAEIIKADGSTEFTITYVRREFEVTFNVNYKNQFTGEIKNIPSTQKVKFEGKAKKSQNNPTIDKHGRTYVFKHWQLESSMNGVYSEQQAYNFSKPVLGNVSLVAYFKETIEKVNYKVVHYLEKQGKEASLNGQYDRIEEIKTDQKVEDGAVYQEYSQLDNQLYEKHTTHTENKLNAQLNVGNNSVEVCQYYKLKEVDVKFKKTDGIATLEYETRKVKKTRSVALPTYTLKGTHNFIGWALSANGQVQSEFVVEKTTNSLEIYAKTDYQDREITYTVKKEKLDGTFDVSEEKKTGKIASSHTVSYANPDSSVYQNPTYNPSSLVVNADKTQNKVVVTLMRKTYQVTFEVKNFSGSIATRTIRHGAKIGEIDESQFAAQGQGILKAELDGTEKTKQEIENFVVEKAHKVTVYIGKPTKKFGQYPQTRVNNPVGIHEVENKVHELKFNSKNKDYTIQFTRSYWQDNDDTKYEKYNGQYYKIEPVDFVKIPKQNTWFTEKIIDFSPFNLYYSNYSNNAKPERSIFKAMVEDIGKILGGEVHMPTYDSGDFQMKPALDAVMYSQLKKESTDYAKAILGDYNGLHDSNYRGVSLSSFGESGVNWPYYYSSHHQYWWLGTQYPNSHPHARSIYSNGSLDWYNVGSVFGVVVCIR